MTLEFYEKPGCGGNARQKEKLKSLGCLLVVKDLPSSKWSATELKGFFEGKPKNEWFNISAPLIKKGDIKLSGFNPAEIREKLGLEVDEALATCNPSDPCHKNQ